MGAPLHDRGINVRGIRTGATRSRQRQLTRYAPRFFDGLLGIAVVAALLAYEHSLVKADDLSKLDAAFFAVNGYISMLFLLFWGAAAAFWRV